MLRFFLGTVPGTYKKLQKEEATHKQRAEVCKTKEDTAYRRYIDTTRTALTMNVKDYAKAK